MVVMFHNIYIMFRLETIRFNCYGSQWLTQLNKVFVDSSEVAQAGRSPQLKELQ